MTQATKEVLTYLARLSQVYETTVHFAAETPVGMCDLIFDKESWERKERPTKVRVLITTEEGE